MRIEREIYNWKYIFDGTGFDITPNQEIEKPNTLFKLYCLNHNSFDSLLNQYIYATHPSQLNDIFDCNEELLDFDDIKAITVFLKGFMSLEEIQQLIETNFENVKIFVQRIFKEIIYRKWGIFSMTSNSNNILMWSYYSNHNGFCIEFDISKFPFKYYGPFPINYQLIFEPLSIKKNGVQIGTLAQTNLKDKIWEHENEWRLIVAAPKGQEMFSPDSQIPQKPKSHDRKFNYPIEAIKSIALGNRFFEPNEIREIDNMTLEITVKNNFKQKTGILDFLSSNSIKTLIGLRTGFTQLKFRTSLIEKIDCSKYKVNALKVC